MLLCLVWVQSSVGGLARDADGEWISSTSSRVVKGIDCWRHGEVVPKKPNRARGACCTGRATPVVGDKLDTHGRRLVMGL